MVPAAPTASIPDAGLFDLLTTTLCADFFNLIFDVISLWRTVPIRTAFPLPVRPLIVKVVFCPLNVILSAVKTCVVPSAFWREYLSSSNDCHVWMLALSTDITPVSPLVIVTSFLILKKAEDLSRSTDWTNFFGSILNKDFSFEVEFVSWNLEVRTSSPVAVNVAVGRAPSETFVTVVTPVTVKLVPPTEVTLAVEGTIKFGLW